MTEGDGPLGAAPDFILPTVPASAGAMIFDRKGRLLILKPTYKSGWTIPGGVMEADGETPWQACQREVREECGIDVRRGKLVCMDFRRPPGAWSTSKTGAPGRLAKPRNQRPGIFRVDEPQYLRGQVERRNAPAPG